VQTQAGRRPGFLFCAGNFLPNGITASFRNLAEGLDAAGIQSHVAVEAAGVAPFPDRSERLRQLPASMEVIGRVGVMAATKEERRVMERLAAFHWQDEPPLSAAMRRVVRTAYKREWRRVFADSQFSSLIAFDGYSTYWTELFAAAEAPRKIIFMHSDLYGEYMLKYPTLARVFACYADFDRLVSVSETACAVNRESLAGRYALPEEKFVWRHNLLSPIRTCEQAAQPLDADIADWLGDTPCFTAIGRLSPEKGLDRLIRAFAAMRRESPQTRLVIAGDGPLKSELRQLADTLGQSEHILFAGYRGNPFPLLRRADCLAFSSVHEGQPMVLLEAMLLGRPVVAADIPPVRDVLGDNYGMLVENSEQGLREGMRAFGNGKRADGSFDYLAFQNAALQGFFSLMQGAGK
jgi:CDP-glycerol glycerophosphotransferase